MAITKTKGYQFDPAQGYLGPQPQGDTYRYMIINDRVEEVREDNSSRIYDGRCR
jgi:hypothetical protein